MELSSHKILDLNQEKGKVFEKIMTGVIQISEKYGLVSASSHLSFTEWEKNRLEHGWGYVVEIIRDTWNDLKEHPAGRPEFQAVIRQFGPEFAKFREYYIPKMLCELTEQDSSILLPFARTGRDTMDFDLDTVIAAYGTAEEVDQMLEMYRDHLLLELTFHTERIKKIRDETVKLIVRYVQKNQLPGGVKNIFIEMLPSAALQLANEKYDLIIGILKGGGLLPNLLHPLGQSVGYLEWHLHWKRSPVWRASHVARDVRKGMKILLVENDAVSGATLKEVQKKIDGLSPSCVDVCFTGLNFEKSAEAIEPLDFDKVFHLLNMRRDTIFTDMIKYRQLLLARLGQIEQV